MASRKRLFVGILLPAAVCSIIYASLGYVHNDQQMYYNLMELSRAYHHFVRDHDGAMPASLERLVAGGYLTPIRNGKAYLGPPPEAPEIIPVFHGKELCFIDEFDLTFGGHVRDFEVREERVYRRDDDTEVIFIRPHWGTTLFQAKINSIKILNALDSREDEISSSPSAD